MGMSSAASGWSGGSAGQLATGSIAAAADMGLEGDGASMHSGDSAGLSGSGSGAASRKRGRAGAFASCAAKRPARSTSAPVLPAVHMDCSQQARLVRPLTYGYRKSAARQNLGASGVSRCHSTAGFTR